MLMVCPVSDIYVWPKWKCTLEMQVCTSPHRNTLAAFCTTHRCLWECGCMPEHKAFAQSVHVHFAPSLFYWAASCLSDYPASSRCQICHLQMSGRAYGAEEWREEIWGKKKERKQNNWFCRHLERVQTGQQEPQSVNGAQGIPTCSIEKVVCSVLGFSTFGGQHC